MSLTNDSDAGFLARRGARFKWFIEIGFPWRGGSPVELLALGVSMRLGVTRESPCVLKGVLAGSGFLSSIIPRILVIRFTGTFHLTPIPQMAQQFSASNHPLTGKAPRREHATSRDRSLESSVSAQGEELNILHQTLREQGQAIVELTEQVKLLRGEQQRNKLKDSRVKLISFGYKKKGPPRIPGNCIVDARRIHDPDWKN